MLFKILPKEIAVQLETRLNVYKLFEIRLRANKPASVNYGGKYYYLGVSGLLENSDGAFVYSAKQIDDIVVRATQYSMFALTSQVNNGYITIDGGVRIGLAGEVVYDGENIRAIKNFSGINIRIPHEVFGCCSNVYKHIYNNGQIKNALIISPPGAGKTTFVRDIARSLGNEQAHVNVLIVDERNEIAAVNNGNSTLDVGKNTDVISNCTKMYAFMHGIRSLRPDVIITDELFSKNDIDAVITALLSGTKIIATTHAFDHLDIANKPHYNEIMRLRLFDVYVNLSCSRGAGTIESVYDKNLVKVYA